MKTRLMEIEERLEWMCENLQGCDWCCGGGDQNWMTARTIDIMVPGDIAADLRYLTAEADEEQVHWDEVKQILLSVPGLSADDRQKLRLQDVLGINFDG